MRLNEKSVEKLLVNIRNIMSSAYSCSDKDYKNRYIKEAIGAIDALLTIVDFEEEPNQFSSK